MMTANIPSDHFQRLGRMIANAISRVPDVPDSSLAAAKEQAALEYLKAIDRGNLRFQEFAVQNLWLGEAKSAAGIVNALRSVTRTQILEAYKRTFATRPTIALIGQGNPNDLLAEWRST